MASEARVEGSRPLRATLPVDRPDALRNDTLSLRFLSEFEEMPAMVLSLAQAARLFGIPLTVCATVLGELVEVGALRRTADGRYGSVKLGSLVSTGKRRDDAD
jgi:hypothetical protein